MTKAEIYADLRKAPSWDTAEPELRDAFVQEMADRRYGWDALTQAWAWFRSGWAANASATHEPK